MPSKLEALGLSTDFMGGVLVAREMEGGVRFALGATIATTKSVLREIGGLEALVDHLGDDYELGARTAAAGYKVELADVVVETALPDYTLARILGAPDALGAQRERPPPRAVFRADRYVWTGVGNSGGAGGAAGWWTWAALAIVALLRIVAAVVIGRGVLGDPCVLRDLWLVPLRDFVALAVWLASFAGNEIEWRGLKFRVRDGKLERV